MMAYHLSCKFDFRCAAGLMLKLLSVIHSPQWLPEDEDTGDNSYSASPVEFKSDRHTQSMQHTVPKPSDILMR